MPCEPSFPDRSRSPPRGRGPEVDLSAPGLDLPVARADNYVLCGGTSLSAPLVADTAAPVMTLNPGFGPVEIDQRLKATALDIAPAGVDAGSGHGRIQADVAVS